MANNNIENTLDRLDEEPILFWGVTASEMVITLGCAMSASITVSIAVFVMLLGASKWMLGIGVGLLLGCGVFWMACKRISRAKEKHPSEMVWVLFQKKLMKKTGLRLGDYFIGPESFSPRLERQRIFDKVQVEDRQ